MNPSRHNSQDVHRFLPIGLYIVSAVILLSAVFLAPSHPPVVAGFCDGINPASVCPPSGAGFICTCAPDWGSGENCSTGCIVIPGFPQTCEDIGMTGGPWPFCTTPPTCVDEENDPCSSSPNACGMTETGTIRCDGSCTASTPSNSFCAEPTCTNGSPGPYPACPLPSCADLGLLGVYPNCYAPPNPTCADFGLLGAWPACYAPPNPTCADSGQLGTYPFCYDPPANPTCADLGLLGVYPNCYGTPTEPTCADSGQLGTYPFCYDPPADPDPVSASLTANPVTINAGNASILTWSSTNATSCTGGGFSTGGSGSGSVSVSPSSTQTYTVTCVGAGGTDTDGATVTVTGTGGACPATDSGTITATPNRVRADQSTPIDIAWTGSGLDAAFCTVTNMNTGDEVGDSAVASCSTSGSVTISSGVSAQTVYRLKCGIFTKDAIVNIVPAYEEF